MSKSTDVAKSRNRSQAVGLLLAGAVIPKTFQKSLMPRSLSDQSLITGITIGLVYMLGVVFQDAVELGLEVVFDDPKNNKSKTKVASRTDSKKINSSLGIGLLTIAMGYWLKSQAKYNPSEKLSQSTLRTFGMWLERIGLAGALVGGVEITNSTLSHDETKANKRNLMPYFVGAGIIYSLLDEYQRTRSESQEVALKQRMLEIKPVRAVALGSVVTASLAILIYGERFAAKIVDQSVEEYAPFIKKRWLPVGHIISAGAMVFGLSKFLQSTYNNIENNSQKTEKGYLAPPITELSSGGLKSFVTWESITNQGRRHIGSKLDADQIKQVMQEKSIEPIRIFVGLDSALDEESRVAMALSELDRTNAYQREVIVAVSPTGTGYINYIMSESFEYMTLGNVASVCIQYSKRPSPMSLDRVGEGHRQFRMLLNGIKKKVDTLPPSKRPRVVIFGESLGAWTSQDALMFQGTDGLQFLGIDRALWIGTPAGSKWKEQVLSNKMLNTERELVGVFDNYEEVLDMKLSERRKLRYVLLTHYNDPIAQFGLDLLVKQPEWIENPAKRPKDLPNNIKYRTPTLFVQMLVDMKNALKPIPGEFVASGHDYRGDLARFIKTVFGFNVSRTQLNAIEQALRQNEIDRSAKIELGQTK